MKQFNQFAKNVFWSFRWNEESVIPTVMFSNPKVRTNIIFRLDELEGFVKDNAENLLGAIPLNIINAALEDLYSRENENRAA